MGSQGASRPMGLKDPGPGAQGLKADGPQGPGASRPMGPMGGPMGGPRIPYKKTVVWIIQKSMQKINKPAILTDPPPRGPTDSKIRKVLVFKNQNFEFFSVFWHQLVF